MNLNQFLASLKETRRWIGKTHNDLSEMEMTYSKGDPQLLRKLRSYQQLLHGELEGKKHEIESVLDNGKKAVAQLSRKWIGPPASVLSAESVSFEFIFRGRYCLRVIVDVGCMILQTAQWNRRFRWMI